MYLLSSTNPFTLQYTGSVNNVTVAVWTDLEESIAAIYLYKLYGKCLMTL